MALEQFRLPDVGEGLTEAEIVAWHVAAGDHVVVNQVLVEIETAKAVVELPAPHAGVVTALHVAPGDVVAVGTPIISVETAAAESVDVTDTPETKAEPVLVGYGVSHAATSRRPRLQHSENVHENAHAVRTKPPVRKYAKEHGIDLRDVTPTGPHNSVTRDDVERVMRPASPNLRGTVIDVRSVQRTMADAMVRSAFTAPHVTEWVDVDVTRMVDAVTSLRAHTDIKISPMLFACAGLVRAATQYPMSNATWVDGSDGAHIHVHADVNLGIAVASPRGLLVPVIHQAQSLNLISLAQESNALIARAREGVTSPQELMGGTITITNVGVFGVDGGTPILVPGQVAILAIGQVTRKPWVVRDREGREELAIRDVMTLSLSFDHRVVDGELGSKVLRSVADYLTDPSLSAFIGNQSLTSGL